VDLEKRRVKLQRLKEAQVMRELEELKDCTFKPRLAIKSHQSQQRMVGGDMYER
jgi:hypothetical protein